MKHERSELRTQSFYSGNHIGDTLYFGSADGMLRTIEYGQPWIGKWKIYRSDFANRSFIGYKNICSSESIFAR